MFSFDYVVESFPLLLEALPRTLFIAVFAMVTGFIFSFFLAIIRLYKVKILAPIATLYISFFRGTPLLVQIYLIFYTLPEIFQSLNTSFGWSLPIQFAPMLIALLIFFLNTSAYQAEIWFAALNAVDYGQMEAAQSVGMTVPQALRKVMIPQALVNAIPNFGNIFINLIKGTSLTFTIQIIDLMAVAKIQAADDYRYLEMYLAVSIVYWVVCFFFERVFVHVEKYVARYKTKTA